MQKVTLGPLSAVITPELDADSAETWVVLLHGFGAPGTDLVGLASELSPLPGTLFVFPAGPVALAEPGQPPWGRAWWPLRLAELMEAIGSRREDDLAAAVPPGLEEASQVLGEALAALERDFGLRPERLVLGGFSQGAMLACHHALRSERPLLGLVLLSGMPIAWGGWDPQLEKRRGLPVFQSHSPDDTVLPYSLAVRLGERLSRAGLAHEFVSFRGGHGISPLVLERLHTFLEGLAPG